MFRYIFGYKIENPHTKIILETLQNSDELGHPAPRHQVLGPSETQSEKVDKPKQIEEGISS